MTTENVQKYKGTLADRAVRERKFESQQDLRPIVYCEANALGNEFKFVYLGSVFAADGLQDYDIRVRIGKVMSRCGKLGHLFDSPVLGP